MGIVLLTIGIAIIMSVFAVLYRFVLIDKDKRFLHIIGIGSLLCAIILAYALFAEVLYCIFSQADIKNHYEDLLFEKVTLEHYLAQDNIEENELLYQNVVSFNKELSEYKAGYNNLWTNWFFNEQIASIDYIELKYE